MLSHLPQSIKAEGKQGAPYSVANSDGAFPTGGNGYCWATTLNTVRESLRIGDERLCHSLSRSSASESNRCGAYCRGAGEDLCKSWHTRGDLDRPGKQLHISATGRDVPTVACAPNTDYSIPCMCTRYGLLHTIPRLMGWWRGSIRP